MGRPKPMRMPAWKLTSEIMGKKKSIPKYSDQKTPSDNGSPTRRPRNNRQVAPPSPTEVESTCSTSGSESEDDSCDKRPVRRSNTLASIKEGNQKLKNAVRTIFKTPGGKNQS